MNIEFESDEDEAIFNERVTKDMTEYMQSLQHPNKVEQAVLKTHLCCERLLEEIILNSLPNPKAVLSARFAFSNKLALVKAIVGVNSENLEVTAKVEILNKIRNQMAHQINGAKISELFNKLGLEYSESSNPDSVESTSLGLGALFGNLIGIKEKIILQNQNISYSVKNS